MKIIYAIKLAVLMMFIQGCPKTPPYSLHPVSNIEETNAARRERGIREIKEDWEFYIHQFNEEKWKYGGLLAKTIGLNEELDAILWEQDYYYTGATWSDFKGTTTREFISVVYDYTNEVFCISYSGRQAAIESLIESLEPHKLPGDEYYSGYKANTNEETLEIADKLLTDLGLSRL